MSLIGCTASLLASSLADDDSKGRFIHYFLFSITQPQTRITDAPGQTHPVPTDVHDKPTDVRKPTRDLFNDEFHITVML
jgi:hypothetical protein